MEIIFSERAVEELEFWKNSGNIAILKRIRILLESIHEKPFEGIGKPERLTHDLAGLWSRTISREHRLVYRIEKNTIIVVQLRFHY